MLESRFAVVNAAALRAVLGGFAEGDPGLNRSYCVDPDDVRAITSAFGVAFDPGGRDVRLDPWHSTRKAPYLVHTGFELAMMLEGRKPPAVFSSTDPCGWLDNLMRRSDPFVADGRFVRHKMSSPMPKPWRAPDGTVVDRSPQVHVALRGEAWRVDAFILLQDVMERSGWSAALERFEGSPLGYEDWQNDWWAEHRRRALGEPEAMLPNKG